jgi:Tfp pilus assembly protein PilE
MNEKSVTFLELLIVIIIIGILATIGFVNYRGIKERTFDREAKAMLKLIQAAEKVYKLENVNFYYPYSGSETDIASINSYLNLDLNEQNWDYTVYNTGCAQAVRDSRNWYLDISGSDPINGTCQ